MYYPRPTCQACGKPGEVDVVQDPPVCLAQRLTVDFPEHTLTYCLDTRRRQVG